MSDNILITYVANVRLPTQRAQGVQVVHTCESLGSNGAIVDLFVPWRFNSITDDPYDFYSVDRNFFIRHIPSFDLVFLGKVGFLIQEFSFAIFTALFLLRRKKHIIYIRSERVFKILSTIYRKRRIFLESHKLPEDIKKKIHIYKRAEGIVVVTDYYKKRLIDLGFTDRKVLWSPDGVSLELFDLTPDKKYLRDQLCFSDDKIILGYVGKLTTMDHEKGVSDLIDAFCELHMVLPKLFLLIVGADDREEKELKKNLLERNIGNDDFRIVKHIRHADAALYMKLSDILVMNYPDIAHYAHYMSPLKLFEYMASGSTIIATDLPSIKEILNDHNSLLIPPGSSMELKKAVEILYRDAGLRHELAGKAHLDVKRFTWDERAKKIMEFLQK